ncbi:hypothetical protein GDO78_022417 [Eleutherodactylus coqui]|uniref:Uncharacterized protein n=2 Tax=Eleutherodactylus coqui TaxID=57060 RepID=A0A8J6JRS8_ELECQ|nr:hypothetical protein GDO78_022417 [Eleutherodactylus coqui]
MRWSRVCHLSNVCELPLCSYPEYTLGCYYCLIQCKPEDYTEPGPPSPEYIICFLGGTEKGLDLFRLELDCYTEGIKSKLQAAQVRDLQLEIRAHLSCWYEDSVLPIHRVVNLFQEKLAYLLHAVSWGGDVCHWVMRYISRTRVTPDNAATSVSVE